MDDEMQRPKQRLTNGSPNAGCLAILVLAAWLCALGGAFAGAMQ